MRIKITTVLPDNLAQMPPIIDNFSDGLLTNSVDYKLGFMVEDELFNDEGRAMPIGTKVIVERVA